MSTRSAVSIATSVPAPIAMPPAAAAAVITINNFAYQSPKTVHPGATVTVSNADKVAHTVTADTGNSLFKISIDPGGTASFTAPTKPGTYTFHCDYHATMHGTLVVA